MMKHELALLITCSSVNIASLFHLSHIIKWGYFSAVSSYGKAQCLFIEDTGIRAQTECGNSINENNLVLIAAVSAGSAQAETSY